MPSTRMNRSPTMFVALLVTLSACDLVSDLERDPDTVPTEEILRLARAGGTLPLIANGQSVDTLIAVIPRGASSRVVTFNTTAGGFPISGGTKEIKVRAEYEPAIDDRHLIARAAIRADTVAGRALVSASVADFIRYLEIEFVKPQ